MNIDSLKSNWCGLGSWLTFCVSDFVHLWVVGSELISTVCEWWGVAEQGLISVACGLWVVKSSWTVKVSVNCPLSAWGWGRARVQLHRGAGDEVRRKSRAMGAAVCVPLSAWDLGRAREQAMRWGTGADDEVRYKSRAMGAVVCVFRVTGFHDLLFAILGYIF